MAEETVVEQLDSPELTMLKNNKQSGYNFRKRRDDDLTENYELFRGHVTINRLIQRQSVMLPLMKQTVKTILKDIDDMPVIEFENLDNDKEAELFKNKYWEYTVEENRMELQDIIDKKQVILGGRSFDQMQVVNGKVKITVQDLKDLLVSRYTDPSDLNSSRFLIHTHIFRPLTTLENNPEYDQTAVAELKQWAGTEAGLIKIQTNKEMLQKKNEAMNDLGLEDTDNPILGEVIVECAIHMVWRKEEGEEEEQIYLYEECEDMKILRKKPLEQVIGVTKDHWFRSHYPYNTWAEDIERADFWCDSIADAIRMINKILNSWVSQLVENRTLRNFGMNFYDSSIEGFTPPANQDPIPGGWYPLPGKPLDTYQHVDIPALSESLEEMNFMMNMAERVSGATATMQGQETDRKITLGEVEIIQSEAKQRIKGMSKFYTQVWKDRAIMFDKMIEAAADKLDAVKIHMKGRNTSDIYTREIAPKDWMTASGYTVKVWSQEEKNEMDTKRIEKLNAIKVNMPDNPKVDEVYKRKMLEFGDFTPEEVTAAMDYEKKKQQMMMQPTVPGTGGAPVNTPPQVTQQPTVPQTLTA